MFRKILLLVVALLALLALLATSALAAPKQVVTTFGAAGSGDGELSAPTGGVAVRQLNGDVYVVDAGADRVQRFDAAGSYQAQFGANGSGDGQFRFAGNPGGVAVDQSDGSVYVADTGNNRVEKFSAAGGYLSQFGLPGGLPGSGDGEFASPIAVAVDPTSHDVFVADRDNNRIQRLSASGTFEVQFGTAGSGFGELSGPIGVAVDSTGSVYVVDSGNSRVQKFTNNGTLQGVFAPGTLNLSPQAITIDPATDHVLVSQYAPDFSGTQIVELTSAGNVVETHGTALPGAGGVDIRSSTGRLYASDGYGSRILALDAAVVPDVTVSGATAVTPTTATVNGSINPHDGQAVTYHFETSTDQATWVPTPDGTPISGNSDTPVTAALTGLQPNTPYFVRIVSSPALNPTVTSSEETFTTQAAAPAVVTSSASDLGADKATLNGTIDPQGSPTTYYFEYGTTTAYGTSVPATQDADAGTANDAQAVSRKVTGLSAGTTYHYRLVGHNGTGTTTGNDRTLTPQTVAGPVTLPDNRAYEQVTPVDKNDAESQDVESGGGSPLVAQASPTGDGIAYKVIGAFPGGEANTRQARHLSRRLEGRWTTVGLNPPRDAPSFLAVTDVLAVSEDLSKALVASTKVLAPGATPGWGNLYIRDTSTGAERFVAATSDLTNLDDAVFGGGARDFSTVLFQVTEALAPGAVQGAANMYVWSDGHLDFLTTYAGRTLNAAINQFMSNGETPVTADGSRVFANLPGSPILAAGPGVAPSVVSKSQRTGEVGAVKGVSLLANSIDGSTVVFKAGDPLTNNSPDVPARTDLYQLNLVTNQLSNLSATIDPDVVQQVDQVPAVSDDGDTVYFSVNQDDPIYGAHVLFVSRHGTLRRIADLTTDGVPWTTTNAQASPSGRYLLFASTDDLTDADTGGAKQWYRYDADSERLDCVTCRQDGAASRIGPATPIAPEKHSVLDDGTVFFDSSAALVPTDANGAADVYEWRPQSLRLISTGTSSTGSYYAGASLTGDDVFFTTRQPLVGQDRDDLVDVYDARVGGGIASQNPRLDTQAGCDEDACQGAPQPLPPSTSVASVSFVARDAQTVDGGRPLSSLDVAGPRSIRGTRARIRVRVPQAGTLSLSGVGVATTTQRVGKAGTYTLSAVLTLKARGALVRQRKLTVGVRVRFTPRRATSVSRTVRLTFKQRPSIKGRPSVVAPRRGTR